MVCAPSGTGHRGLPLELGSGDLDPSLHDTFLPLGLSPAPLPPCGLGPVPCKGQRTGNLQGALRLRLCLAAYLLCSTWQLLPLALHQPGWLPTWSPACHSLSLGLTDSPPSVPESLAHDRLGLSCPALCLTGWFSWLSPHLCYLALPAASPTFHLFTCLPLALLLGPYIPPPALEATPQGCPGCRQAPGAHGGQAPAGMPPLITLRRRLLGAWLPGV